MDVRAVCPFDRQLTALVNGKDKINKMTGSMYAAIAGLQTHMQKMSVIGNNIANANTYGFKPGVTTFTESMYTSISGSTAGGNEYGGMNAAQVGYGSKIGTIDMNMSVGTPAPTGINTHLYLNGNGFFMVGPKPQMVDDGNGNMVPEVINPNNVTLKRVGDFYLDEDGYVVDSNGNCVYGFLPNGNEDGSMVTEEDIAAGNADSLWNTSLQPLRIPAAVPVGEGTTDMPEGSPIYKEIDDATGTSDYSDDWKDAGVSDDSDRVKLQGINLSFDNNGMIVGTTQAGDVITIGVVAVASVINPNGLTKISEGYYQPGGNSGDVSVGTCGQIVTGYLDNKDDTDDGAQAIGGTGKTTILAGYLESSKTDISTEFTDLITTQRGFQANTKIITVSDEMLAELVNMK